MKIEVSIESNDSQLRSELFGSQNVQKGTSLTLESGITLESRDFPRRAAFSGPDTVNLILTAAASVPTSVAASWLYGIISRKTTKSLTINGTTISGEVSNIEVVIKDLRDKETEG